MDEKQNDEKKDFINLGIVLNNKGEVLLIRRVKKETGSDGAHLNWAFPGGKQKFAESRKGGVEREVQAETGYKVSSTKEISLRFHPQFPVIVVYHLCKLLSEKPTNAPEQPWEVEEVKWVRPEELKNYFTTDLDPHVAKELGI